MIRKAILLLLLLCNLYTNAQQISGTISNLQHKELIFRWTNDFLNYKLDTIFADDAGRFKAEFAFNKPGYLTLSNTKFLSSDIYVWPNATLIIEADGKDGSTYYSSRKYSGTAAFINNFFVTIQTSTALEAYGFGSPTYKLPLNDFVKAIHKYFAVRDSIKNAYFEYAPINDKILKGFMFIDSIDMEYFKASVWFSYLNKLKGVDKASFFKSYIEPLNKPNEKYLTSSKYRYFWTSIIGYRIGEIRASLPPSEAYIYQNIPKLIEDLPSKEVRQITSLAFLQTFSNLYNESSAPMETINAAIHKLYVSLNNKNTEAYYREIFKAKAQLLLKMKKGASAPDFVAIDTAGKTFSLKDFKGKIVYIDVWASWCGPCLAELPATKKLLTAIKNSDKFTYIAISIDDKKDDWIDDGLKKHNPPGLQLWVNGGFKSKFATDFDILGIPRYILIDEHGKLINFSAPRPSSGTEIINLINNAIDQIKP